MATSMTDQYLANNQRYAAGETLHKAAHPGKQPIQPAKRVAVVACMDARLDVEDLLGLQTGTPTSSAMRAVSSATMRFAA
ncbi:MAG: hypothetical protein BroJett031_14620 [Betaproteobacteria bacterium]|nr:MAG: hypothetical protein BroJett031_14620 [Betaproteobacteria bacterium]